MIMEEYHSEKKINKKKDEIIASRKEKENR